LCIVPYRQRYIRHICDVNDVYRVMMYCSVSLKHTSDSSRSVRPFCTPNVWCICRVNLWRFNAPEYVCGDNYTEMQYECNITNKDMVNYWLKKVVEFFCQLTIKSPKFYHPRSFVTVFTEARNWTEIWLNWIQFASKYSIIKTPLILCSHLCLALRSLKSLAVRLKFSVNFSYPCASYLCYIFKMYLFSFFCFLPYFGRNIEKQSVFRKSIPHSLPVN